MLPVVIGVIVVWVIAAIGVFARRGRSNPYETDAFAADPDPMTQTPHRTQESSEPSEAFQRGEFYLIDRDDLLADLRTPGAADVIVDNGYDTEPLIDYLREDLPREVIEAIAAGSLAATAAFQGLRGVARDVVDLEHGVSTLEDDLPDDFRRGRFTKMPDDVLLECLRHDVAYEVLQGLDTSTLVPYLQHPLDVLVVDAIVAGTDDPDRLVEAFVATQHNAVGDAVLKRMHAHPKGVELVLRAATTIGDDTTYENLADVFFAGFDFTQAHRARLATEAKHPEVRLHATFELADRTVLADLAANDPKADVRVAAQERLEELDG